MRVVTALVAGQMAAIVSFLTGALIPEGDSAAFVATYKGIKTILLDGDLVNFRVALKDARSEGNTSARCTAAQYALIRGFGFFCHVRMTAAKMGEIWRGSVVYTTFAVLFRELKTINVQARGQDCGAREIPTV